MITAIMKLILVFKNFAIMRQPASIRFCWAHPKPSVNGNFHASWKSFNEFPVANGSATSVIVQLFQ